MKTEMNEQRQRYLDRLAGHVEPIAGAAEMLGVSRTRVQQLIKEQQIEAVKIGHNWFVSSISLQERIDARRDCKISETRAA